MRQGGEEANNLWAGGGVGGKFATDGAVGFGVVTIRC